MPFSKANRLMSLKTKTTIKCCDAVFAKDAICEDANVKIHPSGSLVPPTVILVNALQDRAGRGSKIDLRTPQLRKFSWQNIGGRRYTRTSTHTFKTATHVMYPQQTSGIKAKFHSCPLHCSDHSNAGAWI